jgi:hypothetical protein
MKQKFTKKEKESKVRRLSKGDAVAWRIAGHGSFYDIEGIVLTTIKRGESGFSKLPKGALNKKDPKSGPCAGRIHGNDVNTLNDRYLVECFFESAENKHYYFPTCVKIEKQSRE